jgi:hypothetical protein
MQRGDVWERDGTATMVARQVALRLSDVRAQLPGLANWAAAGRSERATTPISAHSTPQRSHAPRLHHREETQSSVVAEQSSRICVSAGCPHSTEAQHTALLEALALAALHRHRAYLHRDTYNYSLH